MSSQYLGRKRNSSKEKYYGIDDGKEDERKRHSPEGRKEKYPSYRTSSKEGFSDDRYRKVSSNSYYNKSSRINDYNTEPRFRRETNYKASLSPNNYQKNYGKYLEDYRQPRGSNSDFDKSDRFRISERPSRHHSSYTQHPRVSVYDVLDFGERSRSRSRSPGQSRKDNDYELDMNLDRPSNSSPEKKYNFLVVLPKNFYRFIKTDSEEISRQVSIKRLT